ncbi:MAG: AAA family ATPase, partial [Staphylothermus sp.]|nr:AAA family ATPase [Staphylothermus sp.]
MDDLITTLYEKQQRAIETARKYGEIIGWVSRTSPSSITEEGGLIVFDVEPAIYFKNFLEIASAGSYLAVVDIKTGHIISMRVLSVERKDILAELDIPDMYIGIPEKEVSGLLTRTRI